MRGETVTYDQTIDNEERRYVGGVTYTIVDAPLPRLARIFADVTVYARILPATKSARLVAKKGADTWVELTQGNGVVETSYTLHMRSEADGTTVRFWLDKTRPHGIEDAWGFFRATPLEEIGTGPRALVTYGALLDLGPGLARALFEEKLRRLMLSVPQRLQAYVSATAAAARPSPPADVLNLALAEPRTVGLPASAGAAGAATR